MREHWEDGLASHIRMDVDKRRVRTPHRGGLQTECEQKRLRRRVNPAVKNWIRSACFLLYVSLTQHMYFRLLSTLDFLMKLLPVGITMTLLHARAFADTFPACFFLLKRPVLPLWVKWSHKKPSHQGQAHFTPRPKKSPALEFAPHTFLILIILLCKVWLQFCPLAMEDSSRENTLLSLLTLLST